MVSRPEITGDTKVPAHHVDELRIALGGPHGGGVPEQSQQDSSDPHPKTEAKRGSQGAVEDRDRTRRAAEQDRFGQGAVHRHTEARDWLGCFHHTKTPPPNEKIDRKKELAANAIESPNTIWISLRKPPEVSPNANVSPVTMMMITARIFATGPSTDCRI